MVCSCGKPDEATQLVIDEINEVCAAKYYDEVAIEKAYSRYCTLTDSQKEHVYNYADLLRLQDGLENAKELYAKEQNRLEEEQKIEEKRQRIYNKATSISKIEQVAENPGLSNGEYTFDAAYIEYEVSKDRVIVYYSTEFYDGKIHYFRYSENEGLQNSTADYFSSLSKKTSANSSLYKIKDNLYCTKEDVLDEKGGVILTYNATPKLKGVKIE